MIHPYLSPKVKVGLSNIHRKGLFARKPIGKGEIITIVGGCLVAKKNLKKTLKDYVLKIAPGFYLAHFSKKTLNSDDYLNHSCSPNVGVKGNIVFVAMCDIEKNEELTYDYAMTDNDPGIYFKCNCGANGCRELITGEDWKSPTLQKKYKGYFAWHIQEAIKKHV